MASNGSKDEKEVYRLNVTQNLPGNTIRNKYEPGYMGGNGPFWTENAFGDCAQIKNVVVPAGTDISPSAFAEGTRIIRRAVVIPLATDVTVYTQHTPASVPPPPLAPRAVAVPPAPAASKTV